MICIEVILTTLSALSSARATILSNLYTGLSLGPGQPLHVFSPISCRYIHAWLSRHLLTLTVILLIILSGFACERDLSPPGQSLSIPAVDPDVSPTLSLPEQRVISVFKQSSPSVVHITAVSLRRNRFDFSLHEQEEGTGSGFIWDRYGHIVTNYHVIKEGNAIQKSC